MTNWKTTLGGVFTAAGALLFGAPIALAAAGVSVMPDAWNKYIITIGLVMQVMGIFFSHLFSADARTVQDLKEQMQSTQAAVITGDASLIVSQLYFEFPFLSPNACRCFKTMSFEFSNGVPKNKCSGRTHFRLSHL
jgi:hypothetical protein